MEFRAVLFRSNGITQHVFEHGVALRGCLCTSTRWQAGESVGPHWLDVYRAIAEFDSDRSRSLRQRQFGEGRPDRPMFRETGRRSFRIGQGLSPSPLIPPLSGRDRLTPSARSRSEEHTPELQSIMRTSLAVLCL